MNSNDSMRIHELLKSINRLDLESSTLYDKKTYGEVYQILQMKEWKEERFKGLLTSNIWMC